MMLTNIQNLKRGSMYWITLIPFPQMSNPRVKKLYCMCSRTMKQWLKWSLKEGVQQWDMFPGLTELRLIGCLIELIWTPKSKSNTSTPENQLADILTKGNITRDEWNHLLSLFNISYFSPTACTAAMAQRAQQESGDERVTAKPRDMMNLIARTPSFVSSSTSVSPEKKYYGNQDPWKSVDGEDRSGRPGKGTDLFEASDHHFRDKFMESFSSTDYSKLDYDRAWVFSRVESWGYDARSIRAAW